MVLYLPLPPENRRSSCAATAPWATPTNTTYVQASASKAGLMSAADYSKLAAFGEASTYAKKADIANAYIYRGSVATYDKLPSSGQVSGDVYNVESDGRNYA